MLHFSLRLGKQYHEADTLYTRKKWEDTYERM